MNCVLRSVLVALLMLALSAMLAGDLLAAGVDPESPPGQAMLHGAGGPIHQPGQGGAAHESSCMSMIGHCSPVPLQDAVASLAVPLLPAPALLPPDDPALLGRSPEADTPPPRT